MGRFKFEFGAKKRVCVFGHFPPVYEGVILSRDLIRWPNSLCHYKRRKRTRHLIELGGLVVKAGIVDLTGDDRAMIYGAMIWMAEKLNSEDGERARELWAEKGKEAFAVEPPADTHDGIQPPQDRA